MYKKLPRKFVHFSVHRDNRKVYWILKDNETIWYSDIDTHHEHVVVNQKTYESIIFECSRPSYAWKRSSDRKGKIYEYEGEYRFPQYLRCIGWSARIREIDWLRANLDNPFHGSEYKRQLRKLGVKNV